MAIAGHGERKWSKLPPAILRSISLKVTDIVDYVQLRSVCRSWRSAAKPSGLRPQRPLLLLPRDDGRPSDLSFFDLSGYDDALRSLYGLPLGKISTFRCPETLKNRTICGSSFGWLAFINTADYAVSLWNPFSRAHIPLPPLPPFPPAVVSSLPLTPQAQSFVREQEEKLWTVSLSSTPSDALCVMIAVLPLANEFCFCRAGEERWTIVVSGLHEPILSAEFHEGRFYTFDWGRHGMMMCYDSSLNRLTTVHIAVPVGLESLPSAATFVVKAEPDLLMVVYVLEEVGNWLKVFKLDLCGKGLKWEPLDSLGDRAIFLSWNNSYIVRAGDFDGCEEDCVYFSELHASSREEFKDGAHYIDIYSLKERKFRPLSCRWISNTKLEGCAVWLVPTLC